MCNKNVACYIYQLVGVCITLIKYIFFLGQLSYLTSAATSLSRIYSTYIDKSKKESFAVLRTITLPLQKKMLDIFYTPQKRKSLS